MNDIIIQEIASRYPEKTFLSLDEAAQLLGCKRRVIYNWTRRKEPSQRPPRITVGKSIRFPKIAFIQWLLKEQGVV